jgi:hypothetical protein
MLFAEDASTALQHSLLEVVGNDEVALLSPRGGV